MGYARVFIACSIAGGIYLAYAGYNALMSYFKPCTLSYAYDARFPENTREQLSSLLTIEHVSTLTSRQLTEHLQPHFPALKKLKVHLKASRNAHVQCISQAPLVGIIQHISGEKFFLTETKCLLPALAYHKNLGNYTEHITSYESPLPLDELYYFVTHFPKDLYEKYQIHWHDKTRIVLLPLTAHTPPIILTYQTALTRTLLAAIASLNYQSSHKKQPVCDIRFKNHLIIKQVKGGIII